MIRRSSAIRALSPLAACAITAAVILPGIGEPGLLDPWEMDRVASARAMAGPRQVLVAAPEALTAQLDAQLDEGFAVRRLDGSLAKASGEIAARPVHAIVVDARTALAIGDRQALIEARVAEFDRLDADHPFAARWIASDLPEPEVREAIGRARARTLIRGQHGGFWRHAFPEVARADELAPLFWHGLDVAAHADLAARITSGTPSPWSMPMHVVEGRVLPGPLLDTWLVAVSLAAFGASETAVRLPGALLLLLSVALLFVALRRHADATTAWLAALLLPTMPMALAQARAVSLESSAALGLLAVTLGGLALHERDAATAGDGASTAKQPCLPTPLAWFSLGLGLTILLAGRGLGGLTMGAAVLVGAALVYGGGRRGLAAAGLAVFLLAGAAVVILGDDRDAMLRAMRFTRVPFGGGLPATERDLATVIGQVGFGLHPYGGLLVLGAGRLAYADASQGRGPAVWLLGLGAGMLVTMALVPDFDQVVAPVAPICAAIAALLLREALAGKVHGVLPALVVLISVTLLHRETGKDAGTLVRVLLWDPPFGGENAVFQWPEELTAPRLARAVAVLGVATFAIGLARPVSTLRRWVQALQGPRAAAWCAGLALSGWALDLLISLGMRLDVMLRAEAGRTGYDYDRLWTTITATRPEVISGGIGFLGALALAAAASAAEGRSAGKLLRPWRWLGREAIAGSGLLIACAGALIAGLMVHAAVAGEGYGAALLAGALHPSVWTPAALAGGAGLLRLFGRRGLVPEAMVPGRLAPLALLAVAVGGVGVGASAAVGTWSYGLLIACWSGVVACLALAAAASRPLHALAGAAIALAHWTALPLMIALGVRSLEVAPDGGQLLFRMALLAPDSLALLLLALLAGLNHLATRKPALEGVRFALGWLASLCELPAVGVLATAVAGLALASGVAFGLLPEMSVHFSQKHLLATIREAGGDLQADPPVAYKHPGAAGARVLGSNFYTAALPTLASRDEAIAALAPSTPRTATELHLSDWGESARQVTVALPATRRFLVVPKAEFSALNAAYREKNDGRSVAVLSASSSRLVLASSDLPKGVKSANWIDDAILSPAAFAKLTSVQKISADFDGVLELVGWRLAEVSVRRGQKYHLELFFHVKQTVPVSYMIFMHPHPLHRDLWPLAVVPHSEAEGKRCTGCFQTNHWRVGDVVRVDIDQEVPLGTSAGPAEIILGLFDPQTDKRLPMRSVTGPDTFKHNDDRVTIGNLIVR